MSDPTISHIRNSVYPAKKWQKNDLPRIPIGTDLIQMMSNLPQSVQREEVQTSYQPGPLSSGLMKKKYTLSQFDSQFAMEPQRADLTWDQIVTLFSTFNEGNFDKTKMAHFNGCKFIDGADRRISNAEAIHVLVLDFDEGMTVEEAKIEFQEYTHIGYTSYNHQYDKHGDGVVVDKFRILIPLSEPCPRDDWKEISHNVEVFAPGVDKSCTRLHQPFAGPIKRPNIDGEIWVNTGNELDWSDWSRTPLNDFGYTSANPSVNSEHKLHPDLELQTKKGSIRVGDVDRHISGVLCPFHDDKTPGEFINVTPKGYIKLTCHKCGNIYMEDDDDTEGFIEAFLKERKQARENATEEDDSKPNVADLLEFDNETAVEPFNRTIRGNMMRKKYRSNEKRTLMYAAEGFGKSYLATILVNEKKKKVLFACKSNEQVQKQAEGFLDQGFG